MSKQAVKTENAPGAVGPYSQAIIANGFVFTAGQLGIIAGTTTPVEGGVQAQTRQALENIKTVLEAAGTTMDNIVKTTVFLDDMNDFAAINEVYTTFFNAPLPARSAVEVARLPLDGLVEIETVAILP